MTSIQPELWIDRAAAAVGFYRAAFGAVVHHQVGEGDDIVAQLAIGGASFWVSAGGADGPRFSPQAIGGATGRVLLVADDPGAMFDRAVAAGATPAAEMADEHGWRMGRVIDPFGHEWEIGRPLGPPRPLAARLSPTRGPHRVRCEGGASLGQTSMAAPPGSR